ncbi:hypothetical protein GBAR_LOCUS1162, partial [Geodia barretti]
PCYHGTILQLVALFLQHIHLSLFLSSVGLVAETDLEIPPEKLLTIFPCPAEFLGIILRHSIVAGNTLRVGSHEC